MADGPVSHYHRRDLPALVSGALSVLIAVLFLLDDLTPLSIRPALVVPLVLVAVALLGLATGRRRISGRN